jgi:uroporphyrin-III C-methyltransferase/precorrin-2 dehydrogenase/sirohydrochlorin ferrochelatase
MNLRDRRVAVIGGGDVAARKCALLLSAGARITVTAPALGATLAAQAQAGEIAWNQAPYSATALDDAHIVVAATNDRNVNAEVSREAQARRLPVNVVDDPELCSFIMPAIVDRSPLVVAVSTGGSSPVLARLVRARLEAAIPAAYGHLVQLAERFRDRVKAALPADRRRQFWETALQGRVAELVFARRDADAEAALAADLARAAAGNEQPVVGEVYLVGAGPGDPDLLTFAAVRLMQQADVVVHDRLVPDAILDLARRDADRIDVGKAGANHTLPQEDINQLLVRLAKEGRRVVRLKGGDPYVFGRGGEEIDTLAAEGIPFRVVPGVTAATGAAAYAGIPLTHRDHADACVFVTGHLKDGRLDLDWTMLTRPRQTVVIYMGLSAVRELCRQLIDHGRTPETPAALVARATQPGQQVVTGTLAALPELAAAATLDGPTLIIVGDTVALRGKLNWFGG